MKSFYLAAVLFFLLSSIGFATITQGDISQIQSELVGQEIPGFAGTLFGNERMNIYVENDQGEQTELSVVTKNSVFQSLNSGTLVDPTLNVYTDEETVRSILGSSDFAGEFKKALDEKKVRYEAVGFVNSIKFGFVSFISGILDLFS